MLGAGADDLLKNLAKETKETTFLKIADRSRKNFYFFVCLFVF